MGPETLAQVLQPLTGQSIPNLIVGLHTSDDAAVYQISDDLAVIQTVDYFTPIVDDPETFGAIAAANSMSDIFAMGGQVLFGLNVAGFPEAVPPDIVSRIFAGGSAKMQEAGGVVAGGHTVTAPEPFYGMSVTGSVAPDKFWSKGGAQPGDRLLLTKPLGTGLVTTAAINDFADQEDLESAIDSMQQLNRTITEIGQQFEVHACTDITGFGLAGHAFEMADKGNVQFQISSDAIPLLPGALRYAREGQIAGGLKRNRQFFETRGVTISESIEPDVATVLFDPQTSGGLLMAVSVDQAALIKLECMERNQSLWEIGRVEAGSGVIFASSRAWE